MAALAHTEVVAGVGVHMQFSRDACFLQGEVHNDAVIGVADNVGPAMHQINRGRSLRDAQAGSEFVFVLGL